MIYNFLLYALIFSAVAVVSLGFLCIIIILVNNARYEEVYRLYQEKFRGNIQGGRGIMADRFSGSYNPLLKIATFGNILVLKKEAWSNKNILQG